MSCSDDFLGRRMTGTQWIWILSTLNDALGSRLLESWENTQVGIRWNHNNDEVLANYITYMKKTICEFIVFNALK